MYEEHLKGSKEMAALGPVLVDVASDTMMVLMTSDLSLHVPDLADLLPGPSRESNITSAFSCTLPCLFLRFILRMKPASPLPNPHTLTPGARMKPCRSPSTSDGTIYVHWQNPLTS